jgi:hypothetical protein
VDPNQPSPPPPPAPPHRRQPIRRAVKVGAPAAPAQAPAFVQGVQPLDPVEELSKSPARVQSMFSESFALWSQYSGLEVDYRAFTFDDHRYLLPIYLNEEREMAWIKSAQMGATIYEVLRLLWFCRYHTVKAALYFPTSDGVNKLSKDRLMPIIRSNKQLSRAINSQEDSLGLKVVDNVHGKKSSLYMLYLGGTASKDSVPLDIVGFDEVRLVLQDDIDQALERISHSRYKYKMFVSTAGYPNLDIHRRFLFGTQMYWHIKCNCTDGFVPSDCFPECVVDTGKEVYLRCPRCKMRINDPQNGRYIPHNPGGDYPSYHVSQFISKYITPKEIWTQFLRTTNKKEFYNAKLGRPYVDEENMPINDEVLENSWNPELRWLADADKKQKRNCAMGVDQHGGNVYVVIAKRGPDGAKQIVHLEVVESANPRYWEDGRPVTPFKRLHQLMREFDVGMCIIDAMPNYNEATDLARTFPARVYTAWYGQENQKDMVQWMDRLKPKESIKRGSKQIKLKWQVLLNRYTSIDYALSSFVNRDVMTPHPDALLQVVHKDGMFQAEALCRQRFWLHLKSIVRQKTVTDDETGKFKMEWIYLGRDPHFVHAWNYCNIALERLKRQAIFVM